MADENILKIGAIVDLSTFLPSMEQMTASTRAATGAMGTSFQQLAVTTASSTAQMTTAFISVPAAAQIIPPAVRKVEVETEGATGRMGSQWTGLAGIIRTAAGEIIGSLGEVGAKMSETAERSRLGVGTMETAFAGFSSLLGAGIAVGFAAHFLDESARVVIELKHLQVETGISIQTLAGLRAVAQQTAVPFDSVQTALIRMQRAQVLAVEGNNSLRTAFHGVGVSLEELKTLNPEQLFFAISKGMAEVPQKQVAITSGMQIMGRGAYTLIPLLREQGSALQQLTVEAGKNSGVTDKAAESAAKWHQMTAQLAQAFQSFMIPVLEVVIPLVKALQTAFEVAAAAIVIAFTGIATIVVGVFKAVFEEVKVFGQIIEDVFTGNVGKIPEDVKAAMSSTTEVFKAGGKTIKNDWSAIRSELQGIWSKPLEPPAAPPPEDLSSLLNIGKKSNIVQQFREQLDQMRDAEAGFHELSKAEEAAFWKSKLEIVRKSPAAYREVYHEYVTAEREVRKQSLAEAVSEVEQRVQAEQSGSQQRVIILQEELGFLKEMGAEETSEYRRIQTQLVTAQREASTADSREFTKRVADELAEESHNAEARLAIIQHSATTAELFYRDETAVYKFLEEEKLRATIALAEQQRSIQSIDSESVKSHEQSLLDIRRSSIETQYSIGLISNSQRLALEQSVVTQEIALEQHAMEEKAGIRRSESTEYETSLQQLVTLTDRYNRETNEFVRAELVDEINLVRTAMQAKSALYAQDPVEYERVLKQMLALSDRYNRLMAGSENEELKTRMANWQRFGQQISGDFSNAIGQMVRGQKTFGQAMAEVWNNMVVQFAQSLAKMLAQFVIHQLTKVIITSSSETAQTAATAAGAQARAGVGLVEDIKSIGRAAAVGAAHAFKWVMEEVPYPANVVLAPAAAAATFAGILAFRALATASRGALLGEDTLLQAHKGELIVPAEYVPTVLAATAVSSGSGGVGGIGSSISREVSSSNSAAEIIRAVPKNELSLPGAVRAQFSATQAAGVGGAFGTAERGAVLSNDMVIAAHAKEMFLPANISTGLQNAISTGGFNPPPALTQNFSTVGGASTRVAGSSIVHHHSVTVAPTIEYHQHGGEGPDEEKLRSIVIQSVKTGIRRGQFDLGGVIGR